MRVVRVIAAALLLAITTPAGAALQALEQAYELTLDQVSLPGSPDGQLVARPCANCPPVILRLSAQTTYHIRPDNTPVSWQDFSAAVRSGPRSKTRLAVFYTAEARQVTRLVLERMP
jgi:hypothetical protein